VIFRFLDGYEHIHHSIRDTLSVGVWTDHILPSQQSTSLPQYNSEGGGIDDSMDGTSTSSHQGALRSLFGFPAQQRHRPVSTSTLALTDQRIWRTPLAAAVLSCCLLVISIMTQIQSSDQAMAAIE
jgi:hypothetical protein